MKNLRQELVTTIALILAVFIVSCAITHTVTDKDKLLYVYKVYNAQYEDYLSMAKMTNLSEEQKVILRKKKPILEQLRILIPMYDAAVTSGTVTSIQEQKIYDLLNSL